MKGKRMMQLKLKKEEEEITYLNGDLVDLPKDTTPLVLISDVISALKKLPDECIDLIVTSPPYYKQRNYGVKDEIGQESSPNEYINKIVEVGNELRRILKTSGSYFLNIGDKFINKNQQLIPFKIAAEMQKNGWLVRNIIVWHKYPNPMPTSISDRFNDVWEPVIFFVKDSGKYYTYDYHFNLDPLRVPHKTEFQISLPMYLSEEEYERMGKKIISNNNKSNSKFLGHEQNRGASPGARTILYGEYYTKQRKHKITSELEMDIIKYLKEHRNKIGVTSKEIDKILRKKDTAGHWFRLDPGRSLPSPKDWLELKRILKFDEKYDKIMTEQHYVLQTVRPHPNGKNPGNVWHIAPGKSKEAHFSIFPEELPRRVIKACCPNNGLVLDPFAGSGTTGKVAKELNRKSILIEIKEDYAKIIKNRCGDINLLKI